MMLDLLSSVAPSALMAFTFMPGFRIPGARGGYQVARSLRQRAASSTKLQRTPAGAGAVKKWTLSFWAKRLKPGTHCNLFGAGTGDNNTFSLTIRNDDFVEAYDYNSAYNARLVTTQVFRDPTAWMHILVGWDTDNATASSRFYIEVNGSRVSSFSTATYPSLGFSGGYVNSTVPHMIAARGGAPEYGDFYIAEFNFIDGSALTSSDFGQVDPVTGAWVPVNPVGLTYGTNGSYLPFSDNSALTVSSNVGIGKDFSGNGNYWPTTNLSVTPGIGNDSVVDSPTNYGSDSGAGEEVRGNYALLNSLLMSTNLTMSEGNTKATCNTNSSFNGVNATIGIDPGAGKFFFEEYVTTRGADHCIGVIAGNWAPSDFTASTPWFNNVIGYRVSTSVSQVLVGGSAVQSGLTSYTTGDTVGVLVDYTNPASASVQFYKLVSGSWSAVGTPVSYTGGQTLFLTFGTDISGVIGPVNFGQRAWSATAPSSGKALCTQNLSSTTVALPSTFSGNANANGPFVWANGVVTAVTINGNVATRGAHFDAVAGGIKLRTSSSSYNASGSNTVTTYTAGDAFKNARAQVN